MNQIFRVGIFAFVLLLTGAVQAAPIASFLSGYLNADDGHLTELYKRTPMGDQFILNITGNHPLVTSEIPGWGLERGSDYLLRIRVTNLADIAGWIGDFKLTDDLDPFELSSEHVFATNNAALLVTNNYDTAWIDTISGKQAFSYGTKTADPWFSLGYDDHLYGPTANWIWHDENEDVAIFDVEITATTPVPGVASLLAIGLLMLPFPGYAASAVCPKPWRLV